MLCSFQSQGFAWLCQVCEQRKHQLVEVTVSDVTLHYSHYSAAPGEDPLLCFVHHHGGANCGRYSLRTKPRDLFLCLHLLARFDEVCLVIS